MRFSVLLARYQYFYIEVINCTSFFMKIVFHPSFLTVLEEGIHYVLTSMDINFTIQEAIVQTHF